MRPRNHKRVEINQWCRYRPALKRPVMGGYGAKEIGLAPSGTWPDETGDESPGMELKGSGGEKAKTDFSDQKTSQ